MNFGQLNEAILEHMKEPVCICNLHMNVLYINSAMEKLSGFSAGNVSGKNIYDFFGDRFILPENMPEGNGVCEFLDEQGRRKKISLLPLYKEDKLSGRICILEQEKEDAEICKSEEKYRVYVDNAPDGIFVVDRTGKYLDVNEAACKITGYSKEELLKMTILDTLAPEMRKKSLKNIIKSVKSGDGNNECLCMRKDGSEFYLSIEGVKVKDGRYLGFCKDVTERKRLEQDLLKAQEFLNAIINALPDPVFAKDEHHRWIILNDAYCKLMGYKREELLGKCDEDFFPMEEAKVFYEKDELVISSGKENENEELFTDASSIQHTILTKKSVFVDSDNRKLLVGTIRDITERKRAEEERVRLAIAIEQAVENVVITDVNAIIQYVNPAFEILTGYKKEDILGKNISILESKKHDDAFYRNMWETISSGDVWTGTLINVKKDGTLYEVEASICPVKNKEGEIINYVGVERDVTMERKLEKHIRQSQKMEAIGTLAGGIAHDFNNILAIILGYAELGLREIPQNSNLRRKLDGILKAGTRGKELVSQILTFSRQREKEWKPVRISLIVKEAINFMRASLPSTIVIKKNIQSNSGLVMAEPTQIHQVMINLCTNAAHSMREKGGIMEISLRNADFNEEDVSIYPDLSPGSYVCLKVKDSGHGMTNEVIDRIFEPFFTTKKTGEGTGMGLAVVHGIVESHKGVISVTSEIGKGSTFQVFFPKIESSEFIPPDVNEKLPVGKGKILFVDDEEDLLCVEQDKIESLGYDVISCVNSLDALETFRAASGAFDLVITDQTMPFMTGFELASEVKKIKPVPVILCSGYSDLITPELMKSSKIQKYLTKPVSFQELAEAIYNVIKEE